MLTLMDQFLQCSLSAANIHKFQHMLNICGRDFKLFILVFYEKDCVSLFFLDSSCNFWPISASIG